MLARTWQGLTPKQREARRVMGGPQTHTCLVGGSRSGKTFLIVRAIVIRALRSREPSRHLMTRFRANALRASVWLDTYPKVMRTCFPEVRSTPHRMDGFEEMPNGSQIWFGGLDESDRVEKILGQEYATVYAGEVSQIPYSSILVLRTRLAQSGTGLKLRAFYDLNPSSMSHWSNVEFGDKRSPVDKTLLPNPEEFARVFMNPEDNAANLDPSYLASLRALPKMYRQRFYEGRYVVDVEGALWTASTFDAFREDKVDPARDGLGQYQRIVVGVDPSGAATPSDQQSDDIGIVVAGERRDGVVHVLEDATTKGGPREWGRAVVGAAKRWRADKIVAEANFGGEMVRSTIKAVDRTAPVDLVRASRGKVVRAEPVSALYEDGQVRHCGVFPELEEQLCQFAKTGYQGARSPDRGDALVWTVTELKLGDGSTYTLANIR